MQAQFALLGVHVEAEEEEAVDVWDVNWPAFEAFRRCQTQWRVAAGFGGLIWIGLDYAGVDVVLRRRECEPAVFDDILVMETAALKALSETAPS